MVPKITHARFFKGYRKEYTFKVIKQKRITFLSRSSLKSNKDIFFEYFPVPKFCAMSFTMSFDIYMKWKLGYSIFILHIQFFLDSLEFQVNQENIHLTFTIMKVVLALNEHYNMQSQCFF